MTPFFYVLRHFSFPFVRLFKRSDFVGWWLGRFFFVFRLLSRRPLKFSTNRRQSIKEIIFFYDWHWQKKRKRFFYFRISGTSLPFKLIFIVFFPPPSMKCVRIKWNDSTTSFPALPTHLPICPTISKYLYKSLTYIDNRRFHFGSILSKMSTTYFVS